MVAINTVLVSVLMLVLCLSSEFSCSPPTASGSGGSGSGESGSGDDGGSSTSTSTDISVCDQHPRPCHANAECIVTDMGYMCECSLGYIGDGIRCTGVDGRPVTCESDSSPCDVNALCTTGEDGVRCDCKPGFLGNGEQCTDVDECSMEFDDCHRSASCVNTMGGYDCECIFGYKGNGTHCTQNTIQIIAFSIGSLGGLVLLSAVVLIDVYLCRRFYRRNQDNLRRHHERLKQHKRFLQQREELRTVAYHPESNRQRGPPIPPTVDDSTVIHNPSAPGLFEMAQQSAAAQTGGGMELRTQHGTSDQNMWNEALRVNEWLI